MGVAVREKTIEEIEDKLAEMKTSLNKINYLESAIKESSFSYELKRFLWSQLAKYYEDGKMLERAAKAMSNKAGVEISFRDKIDSYITAAELYARMGKVESSDDMFIRALRDANVEQKEKIKLARKNVYLVTAKKLDDKGRRAGAVKFYEKLIKMNLEIGERGEIKKKLLERYKALGMFREAKLLNGV